MEIRIPYGNTAQKLDLDQEFQMLEPGTQELKAASGEDGIVCSAMENPVESISLKALASGKKQGVLIVSDHTRPVPSKRIIPHMLREMRTGNPDIQITLLVATGCHRGTTKEELRRKLGSEILNNENIVVHDCDKSPMVTLGQLPSGADLVVNRLVAEADLVAAEGFIEPHFFAGFSGGRKSILPGVCSRITVLGNHCADFIDHPKSRMGILDGNPINEVMEAAVRMAGLQYIVNVVINEEKQVVAAFAGDPVAAHRSGCSYLQRYCMAECSRPGDIVITSNGGAPLDQNVYQAVKGLTTAERAAAENAVLIMCAECEDGIGGEEFYRALEECSTVSQLLTDIRRRSMNETVPDQWQYQILARILEKHQVIFVTRPELKEAIWDMKMEYASTLADAFKRARKQKGEGALVTVIPNGISLIIRD